jgi:purine-nucleoside phosphorylase
MTDAYDPAMRRLCSRQRPKNWLKQGVYVWFSGPSFETPAEIRHGPDYRQPPLACRRRLKPSWRAGLDQVRGPLGDYQSGAGIKGASPSHEETKREGAKAAARMKTLLTRFLKDLK